jgi:hypothetical protein
MEYISSNKDMMLSNGWPKVVWKVYFYKVGIFMTTITSGAHTEAVQGLKG